MRITRCDYTFGGTVLRAQPQGGDAAHGARDSSVLTGDDSIASAAPAPHRAAAL